MRTVGVLALLVVSACAQPVARDQTHERVELCAFGGDPAPAPFVAGAGDGQTFAAGAPVTLAVTGEPCVSGSCTDDIAGTCDVALDGQTLTVTARFSWVDTGGIGGCTDDCRWIGATCKTPPLAAGTYTIELGDRSVELVVGGGTPSRACIARAP